LGGGGGDRNVQKNGAHGKGGEQLEWKAVADEGENVSRGGVCSSYPKKRGGKGADASWANQWRKRGRYGKNDLTAAGGKKKKVNYRGEGGHDLRHITI